MKCKNAIYLFNIFFPLFLAKRSGAIDSRAVDKFFPVAEYWSDAKERMELSVCTDGVRS